MNNRKRTTVCDNILKEAEHRNKSVREENPLLMLQWRRRLEKIVEYKGVDDLMCKLDDHLIEAQTIMDRILEAEEDRQYALHQMQQQSR